MYPMPVAASSCSRFALQLPAFDCVNGREIALPSSLGVLNAYLKAGNDHFEIKCKLCQIAGQGHASLSAASIEVHGREHPAYTITSRLLTSGRPHLHPTFNHNVSGALLR